ncbi:MAG: hypothetical protein U9R50_03275 [Campylobacterota bacterium]|nr:hypothetical protein [Campylobacterota bacterium]
MNLKQEKRIKRVLFLLATAPFISGFITAMIVFTNPSGMMVVGLGGMLGLWMIAAVASYKAIKGLIFS